MRNDLHKCSLVRLSLALVCGFVLAGNLAVGQEKETRRSETVEETIQESLILKLKHTAPAEMKQKLEKMLGKLPTDCTIQANPSKNLLTLSGDQQWITATSAIVSLLESQHILESQNQETRPTKETHIFQLRHSQAKQVSTILMDLYQDLIAANSLKIATDSHTNSIIVAADQNLIKSLEQLIHTLDVQPKAEQQKSVIEHVELKNLSPTVAIQQRQSRYPDLVLQIIGPNMVIMRGPQDQVEKYSTELRKLDSASAKPVYNVMIRVVWLASSELTTPAGNVVPKDLQESMGKLTQKMGLGDLRTAAQFIINQRNMEGAEFHGSGTVSLQDTCEIGINGNVQIKEKNESELFININVTKGDKEICQLATNISAPLGHPVILGMTPIDSQPSLFVVQIMETKRVDTQKNKQ